MSGDVRYDPTAHEPNTRLRTLFPGSDKFTDVNANDCIMVAHKSGISTFGKFSRPPRAVLRELN